MQDPTAKTIVAAAPAPAKTELTEEEKRVRARERALQEARRWVKELAAVTVDELLAIKAKVRSTGQITSAQFHERQRLRRRATMLCICRCTMRCMGDENAKQRQHGNVPHDIMHIITATLMQKIFEFQRPDALAFDLCATIDVPAVVETQLKISAVEQALHLAHVARPKGLTN
jgi:hypothetical protein